MTPPDGLPLPFLAALSRNKRAMQQYARMSEEDRERVLRRVRAAVSGADMRLIVLSLDNSVSAQEYH